MEKLDYIYIACAFAVAFILTFICSPLAKNFAYKIGAIDVPKDKRRMHKTPIPRIKIVNNIELAILIAASASILYFATTKTSVAPINVCPKLPINKGNDSINKSTKYCLVSLCIFP